jgi:hypothetical protein
MSKITEKETSMQIPKITITANAENYTVDLGILAEFIEDVNKFMSFDNMVWEIDGVESLVLDGTPEHLSAEELRRPLKLLRELRFFFDQLTTKVS